MNKLSIITFSTIATIGMGIALPALGNGNHANNGHTHGGPSNSNAIAGANANAGALAAANSNNSNKNSNANNNSNRNSNANINANNNSNSNRNANNNSNKNMQGQQQGQLQGQQQGQGQSLDNANIVNGGDQSLNNSNDSAAYNDGNNAELATNVAVGGDTYVVDEAANSAASINTPNSMSAQSKHFGSAIVLPDDIAKRAGAISSNIEAFTFLAAVKSSGIVSFPDEVTTTTSAEGKYKCKKRGNDDKRYQYCLERTGAAVVTTTVVTNPLDDAMRQQVLDIIELANQSTDIANRGKTIGAITDPLNRITGAVTGGAGTVGIVAEVLKAVTL